eukprot:s4999_g4.t1
MYKGLAEGYWVISFQLHQVPGIYQMLDGCWVILLQLHQVPAIQQMLDGCWVILLQPHRVLVSNQVLDDCWVISLQLHQVLEVLVSIKQGQWLEDPWKIQGLYNDQTFPRSLEDFFDPCWVERGSAGTTSLTQLPDRKGGAEASIRFNDWLEITTTAMTDVSERSGQWWAAMLLVVRAAYTRWLSATHLEQLAISPEAWTSCAVTHGAE